MVRCGGGVGERLWWWEVVVLVTCSCGGERLCLW